MPEDIKLDGAEETATAIVTFRIKELYGTGIGSREFTVSRSK